MPAEHRVIARVLLAAGVVMATQCHGFAASDPTPKGWMTYVNTKYDFDICYPSTLQASPPAAAGDGQIFTGPGGGTLTVFWRPGTEGDTLAKTVNGEVAGIGASPSVTYTAGRVDWAVRSGRQGDQIFYVKILKRDSDYLLMEAKYPDAAAKAWNAMVGHFAACFESSRPQ